MPDLRNDRRVYLDLFLVGAFMLFLEILLIRWLATEVRVFAYVKNLTLIACYLGMGLGCMRASRRDTPFVWTYPGLAVFLGTVALPKVLGWPVYDTVNRFLAELGDMPLWTWGSRTTTPLGRIGALALLVLLLSSLAAIFVPSGELLGRRMAESRRKFAAYSANVAGSLAGIAAFFLVSALSLPPIAWFGGAMLLGLALLPNRKDRGIALVSTLGACAILFLSARGATTIWSPYQKLTYEPARASSSNGELQIGWNLRVNETFYQRVANLDREFLRAHPDVFPEWADASYLGYDLAYRLKEKPADVLVVGAGTGNDVAAALRNGAGHVDAVEIDPTIIELGRRIHPEHPYDDARVTVVIDDARAYFKRATRRYDLVVFGALDSHTLNASLSNLRLDNYVYTVESFREVRGLLKPDGMVWLLFAFEKRFIGERLYGMLAEAFGHDPVAFYNADVRALSPSGGGATFVIDAAQREEERIALNPRLQSIVAKTRMSPRHAVDLAYDDWPYLYLQGRKIPRLHLILLGALLGVALLAVRPFLGELKQLNPHFFLLGAAFLLIEVQSISRMALLFGNTWTLNAFVISSILTMILLANVLASRLSVVMLPFVYVALFLSLLASYRFPLDRLADLAPAVRVLSAGVVMGLPILFAGVIFVRTFADTESSDLALGSNLLGAIAGGVCESASFVTGLNALCLLALLVYTASFAYLFLTGRLRVLRA